MSEAYDTPMFAPDGRPDPTLLNTITGRNHPDTSHAAALRALPCTGTGKARVLARLQEVHPAGLTDEELQRQLNMGPNTCRPRRVDLVREGWVEDSGERVPSSTGSPSIVWRAC